MASIRAAAAAALLLLLSPALPAGAAGGPGGGTSPGGAAAAALEIALPDLTLVDQDGRPGAVRTDWIGGRIVVIDFIFTSCPLVCPLLSAVMADVQDRLGDAAGKEVRLLSITVDPLTDIPARLKDYAKRYEAGPGWSFLTGGKRAVDRVLSAFGAYTADFADHAPMFLVGDGANGRWTRIFGFPAPEEIVRRVEEIRSARGAARDAGAAAGRRP